MSTSDQTLKRAGRVPAWQTAILTGHHANLLGRARQADQTGSATEVEDLVVEIDTALAGMDRRRNGGGAWRRWLASARNDLEKRRTDLGWAEMLAEARQRR